MMWTVAPPAADPGVTYVTCISRVRNVDLRHRLIAVKTNIEEASADYEVRAEAAALNAIAATDNVGGIVTGEEMVKVYDQRMAGKNGPGRAIYDQIKLLPKGDRCPFCDQRNVSTLDHILPKAIYPTLAVTPLNLVGACMDCNRAKLAFAPATASDVVLHPYFDDITGDQWLKATVVQRNPCAVIFQVEAPAAWNNVTKARAEGQFALLELGMLYSSEAAREISNIRYNLQRHFAAGAADAVEKELLHQWESRRANRLNSWQTALYEALSHDAWFCGGGFN